MIIAIIAFFTIVVVICAIINYKLYSPKEKGKYGEKRVARVLGDTIEGVQYVINDLLFCTNSGQSCQIDHIYINQHGIWVIETKNYAGFIYGNESQQEWTQVLSFGKKKNKFYNPIKQNATHIYHLSKYLNEYKALQSIVVFLSRADISHVAANNVYSIDRLASIKSRITDVSLTVEQMKHYYCLLLDLKNNSSINIKDHVVNIHKMQEQLQEGICPRCGGKLVLRNGKAGQFYGCANYPQCKFTKKC